MPLSVEATAATSSFQRFGAGSLYGGGWILVYNNPVEVRLLHGDTLGTSNEGETYILPPGVTPLSMGGRPDYISGFDIRCVNGIVPATSPVFYAALWEPGLAGLTPTTPFPAAVSPGGTFNFCFCGTSGTTFSEGVINLGATGDLLGYWRLGDPGSPFADSNPYLPALPMSTAGTGVAFTPGIQGALAGPQNDGAVQFNGFGQPGGAGFVNGQYLHTTSSNTRWDLGSSNMSVLAWINPANVVSNAEAGVVGNLGAGAVSFVGWGLVYDWSTDTLFFERWNDGGPSEQVSATVATSAWSFVAATYGTVNGAKLYVNGALAAANATTLNVANPGKPMQIGSTVWTAAPSPANTFFQGGIDEVSVWGSELTGGQISQLYQYGITFA